MPILTWSQSLAGSGVVFSSSGDNGEKRSRTPMPQQKKVEGNGKLRVWEVMPVVTMSTERGKKVVMIMTPRKEGGRRVYASPLPGESTP